MPIETFNNDTTPMQLDFVGVVVADPRGPRPKGGGTDGVPPVRNGPEQVVGAVPLSPCTSTECRVDDACCYINPVLAQASNASTADMYFNDANSFLLNFPTWTPNGQVSCTWYVDKLVNGAWVQQAILNNTANGIFYAFNTWSDHKSYTGVLVQWWKVLHNYGEGIYRIRASYNMLGGVSQCLSSEMFCLQTWSCRLADHTVKWESWIGYKIGSKTVESLQYDLCKMNWYDSIRFKGKFGYEDSDYEEKNIKYLSGLVKTIREEMLQNYTMKTQTLPKWLHDRFKTYFHMADELRVCDYNYTNADWNLNRKRVRRNSGYKPGHLDAYRRSAVTCQYRERVESVVKSICCDDKK